MVHLAPVRQQASKCSEVLQQHIVWQIQIDKNLSAWQHTVAMNTLLQREKRATVSRVDDWLAFRPPRIARAGCAFVRASRQHL